MAIDYSIYVGDPIDTEQLLRRVEDALGLDHTRVAEPRVTHNATLGCVPSTSSRCPRVC